MEAVILFAPLVGAFLAKPTAAVGGARSTEVLTTALVALAAILSWVVLWQIGTQGAKSPLQLFTWISSGQFEVTWSIRRDALTAVMLVVVNTVSALVHCYSIGYMHEDPSRPRFFAYLSLFTFAMLALVTANDLVQLFFGWEGVGLASYLLIGFWHHKPSANDAAIKAFVVNRVGDVGLALGIMATFVVFGSVQFDTIFAALASGSVIPLGAAGPRPLADMTLPFFGGSVSAVELIAVLLFIGAMGKSAQFLLHTWLPDAMEGPTPVSALIHAATMVTAGVFLVCRMSELYAMAPVASTFVTVIGAITAVFAATVGLVQTDIKRVIAYSTASQLGYMFFAAGVGGYAQAMFHLTTHAFFKALLFLCAGAIIHFSHHEQDMRHMGGLRAQMPLTFVLMVAGTLAITGFGIPGAYLFGAPLGFAGFVSKDMMLEAAYAGIGADKGAAGLAFGFGLLAAVMTAFYSWRLIFLVFDGRWRAPEDVRRHPHAVPNTMLVPLVPLALGAVVAGMAFYKPFVGSENAGFWGDSLVIESVEASDHGSASVDTGLVDGPAEGHAADARLEEDHGEKTGGSHHDVPVWVLWAPFIAGLSGFLLALFQYRLTGDPLRRGLIGPGGLLYGFLLNRWYIDDIYRSVFLRPARSLSRLLWHAGDERTIDGIGPNGVSRAVTTSARTLVRMQTGYVYTYAFVMLIGVTGVLFFALTRGGS